MNDEIRATMQALIDKQQEIIESLDKQIVLQQEIIDNLKRQSQLKDNFIADVDMLIRNSMGGITRTP